MMNDGFGSATEVPNRDGRFAAAATRAAFRGPLRYEVKTSLGQLEAGRKFTVFLKITNPYDIPVHILHVDTQIPVEFMDALKPSDSFWSQFTSQVKQEALRSIDTERVSAHALGPGSPVQPTEPELGDVVLQPGNSALRAFTLRTRRETSFTPSTYCLQIQVKYEMAGLPNHDTVEHQLNVRAPMKALINGALAGAVMGFILRAVYSQSPGTALAATAGFPGRILAEVVASALVACAVVIAFARKKDAQPFIAIEDVWGGMFVGIVAGYGGQRILDGILG